MYALVPALLRFVRGEVLVRVLPACAVLRYPLGTGVLPVCSACAAGTRCPPCCHAGEPSLPALCGVGLCPTRVLLPCRVYVDGEARGPGCVHGGGTQQQCLLLLGCW